MKHLNIFVIIILFLNSCTNNTPKISSSTSVTNQDAFVNGLEECEFQDTPLLNNILNICKSEDFKATNYYIFDFYTSGITTDNYFLFIRTFVYDSISSKKVNAFVVLDNKTFMFNKEDLPPIYYSLKKYQEFDYKELCPEVGGGFYYLIYGVFNKFSIIIRKEIGE